MRQIVLDRPGPVALTLDRPAPESITLNRPGPMSIVLQLVGDRPATGDDAVRIVRTLVSATRSLAGSQTLTAQIGRTLPARSVSLAAGQYLTAQVSRTVPSASRAIVAYQPTIASITRTIPAATRSLVGDTTGSAFIMRSVPAATRSLSASQYLTASIARTNAPATRSLIGILTLTGSISRTISSASRSASASQRMTGAISRAANAATRGAAASQYLTGAIARTAGSVTRSLSAKQTLMGSITRTIPASSRSLTATITLTGAVSRSVSSAARSLAGSEPSAAIITRTVASATRALAATQTVTGAIARSRSAATRSLSASGTLWTFANLATPLLEDFNPATFTWSGSNFSSGTNPGSLGGTYATEFGTPTKTAADLNGFDVITYAGNSGVKLPSVTMPTGNWTIIYVVKRLGNPTGSLGPVAAQWKQQPGWALYDQINLSTTVGPGGSQNVAPGDIGFAGWPSGTGVYNRDVLAHPPTDDGAYHVTIARMGTSHLINHDGSDVTPTYSLDAANSSTTGDLTSGTSGTSSNQHANIRKARRAIMLNATPTEEIKAVGYIHWYYGLQADLPSGHPYKSSPPLV